MRPAINPRSTWAIDRLPLGPLETEDVRFVVVHHSATQDPHLYEATELIQSFYDLHTGPERGWNDIAYNFLIDPDGGVWEGREGSLSGPVAGDATGGNQGFSQLVCVIGHYSESELSEESRESLVTLLAWLADRYAISTRPGSEVSFASRGSSRWEQGTIVATRTITGHRTMSFTSCPGERLNAYVEGDLMADVEVARQTSTATVPEPARVTDAPVSVVEDVPERVTPSTSARPVVEASSELDTPGLQGWPWALGGAVLGLVAWRMRRMRDG